MTDTVAVDCDGQVAVIRVNRPEVRNAWDVATYRLLTRAIHDANENDEIGAIVITASGSTYCAGVDVKAPKEPPDESGRRPSVGSLAMGRDENWPGLLASSKPTVAAVNGPAVGLGATHLLATDVRVAADSATFRFPFLSVGILPELGSTTLLARLIGEGRARELILTGRALTAAEAQSMGLVSHVWPDGELVVRAIEMARAIADLPRHLVRTTRDLLSENARETSLSAVLEREGRAFVDLFKAGSSMGPTGVLEKGRDRDRQ